MMQLKKVSAYLKPDTMQSP